MMQRLDGKVTCCNKCKTESGATNIIAENGLEQYHSDKWFERKWLNILSLYVKF